METDLTLADKCEHLMNVVVESRKRFGKMCIDYEQKTYLMENKMLNLQLETISTYRFKPKHAIPNLDVDEMSQDSKSFTAEILEKQKKIENLQRRLKSTQDVVLQLKKDNLSKKLRDPVSVKTLMARAKQGA